MVERVFLGWERPLCGLLVEWLLARRERLPGMLVVVPTAQAGRVLREGLATAAGALLAPKVVTPEFFFRPAGEDGVASSIEARFAWIDVLRGLGRRDAAALFPVEPVERSFSWASGVARELEKVRNALAEGGRSFADAAALSPERDRWVDLVEIENRVMARFTRWGMEDPLMAKLRAAAEFIVPRGIEEVVIGGVPDPVPLALEVWKRLSEPVRVLIHAPESEAGAFDQWGRPLVSWIGRRTPVERERVHLVAGPSELADKAVACCSGLASDEVAMGLCDPACGPALEAAFGDAGWPAWNPEGRAAGRPMTLMLEGFAGLARRADRWDAAAGILRNPLLAKLFGGPEMHGALGCLDGLEARHLPDRVSWVRELCAGPVERSSEGGVKLAEVLDWCLSWRDRFTPGKSGEALAAWVDEMGAMDDGAEGQLLAALAEAVEPVKRLEARGLLEGPGEALELVLSSIDTLRSAAGRELAGIDLSGWLELSHTRGRRMVLAGMHEGCVPDGSLDDAFLPDGVRKQLGLRDAEGRHARDAYLFHSFAASRELEVIVAKVDASGEPRRPSRLLLAARGVELAERVRELSGSPSSGARRLAAWARGDWKLTFSGEVKPYLDGRRKLSPSAIRDYLHCPFRFYLKRMLNWDRHDAAKMEMDARDFGNLCHGVLEQMGRDEAMREVLDARELRDFLWEKVDRWLAKYGGDWSLPILVQREAARSRMERFASVEVAERARGWRTRYVELKVGNELPWEIDGQAVSMQIDRVDFHPQQGWRVLDYKTAARAEAPRAAHLRKFSEKRSTFGPTMPAAKGADEVWKNVQLPLYAAFVQQWLKLDDPPTMGYVNLPATLGEVGFQMWEDFESERLECAMEWAGGVIGALRRSVHWPPVALGGQELRNDDFALLAPDGLEEAVMGALIEDMKAKELAWSLERGEA